MTIMITSSTSEVYVTSSHTTAYVVPGANVGAANGGLYVSGNYDVITNAGTIHGEIGIIFGNTAGHGEGDVFVNLASGYVQTNPAEPGTTVLFNTYSGTVINSRVAEPPPSVRSIWPPAGPSRTCPAARSSVLHRTVSK
jgi:hypothetical protein